MTDLEQGVHIELMWFPFDENSEPLDIQDKNFLRSEKKVCRLRKIVSNVMNVDVSFCDIKLKAGSNNSCVKDKIYVDEVEQKSYVACYSECIYSINCYLNVERRFADCYKQLLKLFCTLKKADVKNSELWLKFDISLVEKNKLRSVDELDFKAFAFGNIVGLNVFVQHFSSVESLQKISKYRITQVKGKFSHDYQAFELYFIVGKDVNVNKRSCLTHRLFKFIIPYSNIHRILVSSSDTMSLYFRHLLPPLLYAVVQKDEDEDDYEEHNYVSYHDVSHDTKWVRVLDLYKEMPPELRCEFSMNTVLRLDLVKPDYSLLFQLSYHCKSAEILFSPMFVMPTVPKVQFTGINSKNFDCFYCLKCLQMYSYELQDQMIVRDELKAFNKYLENKCKENETVLIDALTRTYRSVEQGNIVIFSNTVKVIYDILKQYADKHGKGKENTDLDITQNPAQIVFIKRAVVTPTHVRYIPPEPILKSRGLRVADPSFTIRVIVRDVNLDKLNFTLKGFDKKQKEWNSKFLEVYIKKVLLHGIKIGNRHHLYYGASTSQLKSHSLWYYAKDSSGRTVDDIRNEVGNLEEIRLAPKYMARLGQTFSQALGCINVPQKFTNVNEAEPDVKGYPKIYMSDSESDDDGAPKKFLKGRIIDTENGFSSEPEEEEPDLYVFSDGIGRMSEEIADEIYKELDMEKERPSAVQIRYGGCKGMLVVDPKLEGKKIFFRESMKKYNSSSESLEILKTSKPRRLFLNRPFICILENKGIKKETFIHLQKLMIQSHIKSMFYEEEAKHLLNSHSQLRLNYNAMYKAGISFTEDALFRSMILAIFKKQMQLLKSKARIVVPEDKGRTVFGVLDETLTLEYGQVFIQVTKWTEESDIDDDIDKCPETEIIKGIVLVTKQPCMHPGDIRKFCAVDCEDLRHIKDCIVFPAKGPRPHPDEMAGSDLDGDEYCVLWYKDLIFDGDNSPAMHFAVPKDTSLNLERPVQVADELNHFCNYMMNDNVGLIASAHLAWADFVNVGSKICISLAKEYAKALDFPKSGKIGSIKGKQKRRTYPDFMEKHHEKKTYLSKKTLGHLYRNCKRLEMGFEATADSMEYKRDSDLEYNSWKTYEKAAKKTYREYVKKISSCLRSYNIANEGELLSGSIFRNLKHFCERNEIEDLQNILELEMITLFHKLEKRFYAEFGGKPKSGAFTENMFRKASAWYMVTYDELNSSELKYFGLPWAVSDILTKIKLKERCNIDEEAIFIKKSSFIEEAIDSCVEKYIPLPCDKKNISSYRMYILDVALKVLIKWLNLQEKNLLAGNVKNMKKCILDIFESVSSKLMYCNERYLTTLIKNGEEKKVISPGYYVLESLLRLADMGINCNPNVSFSDSYQEYGMCAWITLIKLACSCNTQYLGLCDNEGDEDSSSFFVEQDDMIETIYLPLSEVESLIKEKLMQKIIQEEDSVKNFLLKSVDLKDIEMRTIENRFKGRLEYSLRLLVVGSRFSIERLKDKMVLPSFFDCIVDEKPLYNSIK